MIRYHHRLNGHESEQTSGDSKEQGSLVYRSFSSVQSLSHVWFFLTPWTAACQASLSISNSQSLPKLMSIESVMPSKHLILCHPLLLLPSIFPSIRLFSNESASRIRWPKYWSFSFNISPPSEHPCLIPFIFFYFLNLQYCIGFAIYQKNPPQVYMCSPSWSLLPPPSPYHPSGSSQCTSPKHPVSCIEPGLATHFIYDIIHVSMPFSQIIPPSPSPTERGLFYTTVSLRMDWLDLRAVQGTLKGKSRDSQHHSSKTSILLCSAFFIVQLSHPYMTTGKTIALTRQTLVDKVMSPPLNMLSKLIITFLPRSKRLLISWLKSPSAVILEPPQK